MVLLLSLLIGIVAGLRAMTAPAAVSWAASLGWIDLGGTWLAFLGYRWTPWISTALALVELVTDQLPSTPSRKVPVQFGARIVSGALCGAAIGSSAGMLVVGLVAGIVGAVVGTLGGAAARRRLPTPSVRSAGRVDRGRGRDRRRALIVGASHEQELRRHRHRAGQAGPSLAGRLTAAGKTVAVVERHLFGGTCVNTGCMPTKTLVASAYAAHLARRGAEYGVAIDGRRGRHEARARACRQVTGLDARARLRTGCGHGGAAPVIQATPASRPGVVAVGEALSAPRIFINVGGRAAVPDMPGVARREIPRQQRRWSALENVPASSRGDRWRYGYWPRVRADVSPLRGRGDGRREGVAAFSGARTRTSRRRSRASSSARASTCALTLAASR